MSLHSRKNAGASENSGYVRVPLKGYYKGTIRVPLRGYNKGLEFPKLGDTLCGGPYNKDPTI